MTFATAPSSPHLQTTLFRIPNAPACISIFAPFQDRMADPPFCGTFNGIVIDVQQALDESQAGNPKLRFNLIDRVGTWFTCCAIGQHALSKALVHGNAVVLYHVSGRPQIGDSKACAYLYKEANIIMTACHCTVPPKRLELCMYPRDDFR